MLMINKIENIFCHYRTKLVIKSCGIKSYIKKPMRIIGGKQISIGDKSFILNGARIEAIEMYNDQRFKSQILIGNNVEIGQNVHLIATDVLTISDGVLISGNVYIGDCSHEYTTIDKPVSKQNLKTTKTSIGENSFIGYGAVIQPGAQIGRQCIIGSNAVVRGGKYPDYCVLAGVPARIKKQFNFTKNIWEVVNRDYVHHSNN